jgi:hypothetical protein
MKTVLICHEGDRLNRVDLARWLASFTTCAGIVVVMREHASRARRRWKSEITRGLDEIRPLLERIGRGEAQPIDVSGRPSAVWGQPWMTAYLRWKRQANVR